jgi:5-methylthioribose kinase
MSLAGPGQPVRARNLIGGISSNVLKVSVDGRTYCLKQALPQLKAAREWLAPVARVFSEIDWMRAVAAIVPDAVPRILGVDRETGCFAMEFLPEDEYSNWKTCLLRGEVRPDVAQTLGETLATIHSRTARKEELARKFANDDAFYALRLESYLAETARNHPALESILLAVLETTANTKLALVHGDVSPKNILLGPRGPVILDAECAWYGDPAFDLAFCLNHLLLKAVHVAGRSGDCLAAFTAMSSAYLGLLDWEPREDFEKRIRALLPCLILARVDGKSPAEYLSDPERERVRKAAIRLIESPPEGLAKIRAIWEREIRS